MIKITKPGQKEFHGFCKWCGCEFTYEISDLKLSATSDKLDCPTCGKTYHHPSMVQDPTIPGGIGRLQTWPPEPIPTITPDMTNIDPCAGCAWRAELLAKGSYIGDIPCDYCNKNPYKVTCLEAGKVSTADYPKAVYGVTEATLADRIDCDAKQTSASHHDGCVYTLQSGCSDSGACTDVMNTIIKCCEANTAGIATNNAVYSPKNGSSVPPAPPTSGSNAVKSCNSCSGEHNCVSKKNCKGKH